MHTPESPFTVFVTISLVFLANLAVRHAGGDPSAMAGTVVAETVGRVEDVALVDYRSVSRERAACQATPRFYPPSSKDVCRETVAFSPRLVLPARMTLPMSSDLTSTWSKCFSFSARGPLRSAAALPLQSVARASVASLSLGSSAGSLTQELGTSSRLSFRVLGCSRAAFITLRSDIAHAISWCYSLGEARAAVVVRGDAGVVTRDMFGARHTIVLFFTAFLSLLSFFCSVRL